MPTRANQVEMEVFHMPEESPGDCQKLVPGCGVGATNLMQLDFGQTKLERSRKEYLIWLERLPFSFQTSRCLGNPHPCLYCVTSGRPGPAAAFRF